MIKTCISVDWLQIHVACDIEVFHDREISPSGLFRLVKKDIRHNVFGEHREILTNITGEWDVCAVISYAPLSNILPPTSGHIKIINKFLYQSDLERLVDTLLRELNLKFKSVSRLDIALDIKKFKDVSVPQFFKKVIDRKYLKRYSSSIHIDGKATKALPIHYMRFGSKHSPVQFYIYNKSKELREKTDKPYIKAKWSAHGLNYEHYDIWRIEFVLHPSQYGLIEGDSGEAIEFNSIAILEETFLNALFEALFEKHCHFIHNDGQQRKERMKTVLLLKKMQYENIYIRVTEKETSNRMDKIFIKKLYQLNHEWRIHNKDETQITDFLHEFVDKKDLRQWFENKMLFNPINTNHHDTEKNETPQQIAGNTNPEILL